MYFVNRKLSLVAMIAQFFAKIIFFFEMTKQIWKNQIKEFILSWRRRGSERGRG